MELNEWISTKIGQDIWKNKYQNGNESFDNFIKRVSGGNKEIAQAIMDKTFVPAGRILANRGLGKEKKVTYSNCFVSGTKIKMSHGLKNIEDVQIGDMVMTASGEYHKVEEVMSRSYSGEMYEVEALYLFDKIKCTPNHKFLTDSGWKEIQDIVPHKCSTCLSPDKLKVDLPYKKLEYIDINAIKVTDEKDVTVYNLSVETDHTYVANGAVVHNCYVVKEPEDSLESIFQCASDMAKTFSYSGGVGIDISKLSPDGAKINNSAKNTSGATSFCSLYSLVSGLISQGNRRGALMISLACDHPDLEEFIELKATSGNITKANISVRVFDDFMQAVIDDKDYKLHFYRSETDDHIEKVINARDVFYRLAEVNHAQAEPGCLFWSRIEDWNLLSEDEDFSYSGVNPCAEEPLPSGGSCLLGAINLSEMYNPFLNKGEKIDYELLKDTVRQGVIFLNEVLHEGIGYHALEYQRKTVYDWRQIGLGVMGWADLLIKCGVKYGSKESLEIANKVGFTIANEAIRTSANCTGVFGKYPKYKDSVLNSEFFIKNTDERTKKIVEMQGLANSQILTIAPTGSISTMLGISGGLEPVFANSYTRKTVSLQKEDTYYKVYTPIVKEYMETNNLQSESYLPGFFVTAPEIDYHDRIDMQSVWQEHIDASISSTVNLPENTTVENIFDLYVYAWTKKLKGITVYRENCQREGILKKEEHKKENVVKEDKKTEYTKQEQQDLVKESIKDIYTVYKNLPRAQQEEMEKSLLGETIDRNSFLEKEDRRGYVAKTNDSLSGKKRKLMTGCGTLHAEGYFDPETGKLCETFLNKGSKGGCNSWMVFGSRMISYAMRLGGTLDEILDEAKSSPVCPSYASRRASKHDVSKGQCCASAVMIAIKSMYEETQSNLESKNNNVDKSTKQNVKYNNDNLTKNTKDIVKHKIIEQKQEYIEDKQDVEHEDNDNGMSICPECGEKTYVSAGGCGYCTNDDCCFSGCD